MVQSRLTISAMATTPADFDIDNDALAAAARRVRESGALGNSAPLRRMFDFLTEASIAGRAAKESEIAIAVFDRINPQAVVEDATVRVYMHRLRKKLHDYHTLAKAAGEGHVAIPRGEYRLVYVPYSETDEPDPLLDIAPPSGVSALSESFRAARRLAWPIGVALALVAALAIGFLYGRGGDNGDVASVRKEALWANLIESNHPTSVVVGDFYLFGDRPDRVSVTRLVREPDINSAEELDRQLMANPDLIGHHVDLGVHAMPISIAPSLQRILPVVTVPRTDWRAPRTLAMSESTADRFKLSNVVYVGLIGNVGALRAPLLRSSKVFALLAAKVDPVGEGAKMHDDDDFAYLASFPGPNGNRVVVIAGLRDAGLIQAAEIATTPALIADLASKAGTQDAFDAVFRVAAVGTTNFGAQLVQAGKIDSARLWLKDAPKR